MLNSEEKETVNTAPASEAGAGGSSKKAYQSPELRIYGNIKNLTQAVTAMGMVFDDATNTSHHKTG